MPEVTTKSPVANMIFEFLEESELSSGSSCNSGDSYDNCDFEDDENLRGRGEGMGIWVTLIPHFCINPPMDEMGIAGTGGSFSGSTHRENSTVVGNGGHMKVLDDVAEVNGGQVSVHVVSLASNYATSASKRLRVDGHQRRRDSSLPSERPMSSEGCPSTLVSIGIAINIPTTWINHLGLLSECTPTRVYQDDRWSHRTATEMCADMVRPIAHFGSNYVHTEGKKSLEHIRLKKQYMDMKGFDCAYNEFKLLVNLISYIVYNMQIQKAHKFFKAPF
nr:hypothetical protein [Tanacetum cinerariifolium]